MIEIKKSPLKQYFQDVSNDSPALNQLFFLEKNEANRVWQEVIDVNAKGLYDLPDGSWIAQRDWTSVGSWIDAYNEVITANFVPNLILQQSNWSTKEPLFLIQDSNNIVSLDFGSFSLYWQSLFAAFDDGPLLMSHCFSGTVFRFTPLGNVLAKNMKKLVI